MFPGSDALENPLGHFNHGDPAAHQCTSGRGLESYVSASDDKNTHPVEKFLTDPVYVGDGPDSVNAGKGAAKPVRDVPGHGSVASTRSSYSSSPESNSTTRASWSIPVHGLPSTSSIPLSLVEQARTQQQAFPLKLAQQVFL